MTTLTVLDTTRTGKQAQDLESKLRGLIVGQDEAIQEVVTAYQNYQTGFSQRNRPIGNFLFLGPTGSGKTRIVEATAQALLGDANGVVKIDCTEYQHSHEIAKLIGSPPGYLGHRETGPLLSQEALNRHHTEKVKISLVLFDEVEKASDALWNLLLGVLDKGVLTLGDNRKVDFSSSMIFLTSNLGAQEMCAVASPKLGFHSPYSEDAASKSQRDDRVSRIGAAAARRKFTPEFINRLDTIVAFKALGEEELRRILDIELDFVKQRIQAAAAATPFQISVDESARERLLKEGTDARYGARHLKRTIERMLVQPLSNLMASGQIRRGDYIMAGCENGVDSLIFCRQAMARDFLRSARSIAA